MMVLLLYIGLGLLVGLLAGLLGTGGGIITVPALFLIFEYFNFPYEYSMHLATGTSLACMVISTAGSTWVHNKKQAIQWKIWRVTMPGIAVGAPLGVFLAQNLSTDVLKRFFGFFLIVVALKFLMPEKKPIEVIPKTPLFYGIVGGIMGFLSGALGIGGATFMVPVLLWTGFSMKESSATTAACIWPMAVLGTLMQIVLGLSKTAVLPPDSWGFVYWPAAFGIGVASLLSAPLGVFLAHHLSARTLKVIFSAICLMTAGKMVL
jgi:uncharacterized membrane protein YfcA